jgi:hypothetical protein
MRGERKTTHYGEQETNHTGVAPHVRGTGQVT